MSEGPCPGVGRGGGGGWGRGHSPGCRALPRGRPRPALRLCPAGDGALSTCARRAGPWVAPPSRKKPPTSSPFSPLDPARPGRPCRDEVWGQSCRVQGRTPHRHGILSGGPVRHPQQRACPGSRSPAPWGPTLTGSPLGPFSPGAPWRPASPCRRFGGERVPTPRAGARLPTDPSSAGHWPSSNLLAIQSWHAVPAVLARHALGTGGGMRPAGQPPTPRPPSPDALQAPARADPSHPPALTGPPEPADPELASGLRAAGYLRPREALYLCPDPSWPLGGSCFTGGETEAWRPGLGPGLSGPTLRTVWSWGPSRSGAGGCPRPRGGSPGVWAEPAQRAGARHGVCRPRPAPCASRAHMQTNSPGFRAAGTALAGGRPGPVNPRDRFPGDCRVA